MSDGESSDFQPETPSTDEEPNRVSPVSSDHLLFGLAGVLLGVILGYTVAFQIHSPGRPGFQPPSRPNVAAMQPGPGVNSGSPNARAPFLNEDGSIDMDKVPAELKDQMEQAKTMIEQHKKMLEEDPDNVDLLLTIGRFYTNLGMMDKGLPYFERAVESEPDRPELRTEHGLALYDAGRFEAAVAAFQGAAERSGGDPDILTHMALSHLRLDHVDEALQILSDAAEANPQHAMSRFNAAVIHLFANKDADAAERSLNEARILVPEGDHRMQMMTEAIQRFRDTGELPMVPAS